MKNPKQIDEAKFPSVELAYPIAVDSYDVAIKRLDLMDGRLQTLLTIIVTFFAAFVTIGNYQKADFSSYLFAISVIVFFVNVAAGIYARLAGSVKLLNPDNLYKDWLADSEWEFKKNMIYFASMSFTENMTEVYTKWQFSVWLSFGLFLQAVCQLAWVTWAHP
ncbi:MAG: hypothetical protein WBD27_11710 [Pyrinomonadaceae bacterium]